MQRVVRNLALLPQFCAACCGLVLSAAFVCVTAPMARALSVIETVNDDPITDYDVQQMIKLDKVLHRPATPDAAMEDIIADRLKIGETMQYKINATDQDINTALAITAHRMKMQPQDLLAAIERAGVGRREWRQHWQAEWVWDAYVHALYRTLDVSESEVRAALAKEGPQAGTDDQYTLRQVILTLPYKASPEQLDVRMREATQLRARFTNCQEGAQLAGALQNVALKDPMTREGSALGSQLRDLLNNTPVGHLTPPARSPNGIEMIAVCSKSTVHDDSARYAGVRAQLLDQRLRQLADKLYKKVRARAVIVKR